jgi:hypothetical protein
MRLWESAPALKPLRVGVVLGDLTPRGVHQPDLFDEPEDANLTKAIDRMNTRFRQGNDYLRLIGRAHDQQDCVSACAEAR